MGNMFFNQYPKKELMPNILSKSTASLAPVPYSSSPALQQLAE
jgi:hypothetical protein